jgi:hypothetical protein
MTKAQRQLWADTCSKLYEEGRLIRFSFIDGDKFCALGAASILLEFHQQVYGDLAHDKYISAIRRANDSGPSGERADPNVLPSGFSEALRLIKSFPTED